MDGQAALAKRLSEAKQQAKKRAEAEAEAAKLDAPQIDYSVEECLVLLQIEMFRTGLTLGMGVLPDGMATYVRLRMPSKADDPRAGQVAFLAGADPLSTLTKAVYCLEAPPNGAYWKPDRFASPV
jgi:hypothetical protein